MSSAMRLEFASIRPILTISDVGDAENKCPLVIVCGSLEKHSFFNSNARTRDSHRTKFPLNAGMTRAFPPHQFRSLCIRLSILNHKDVTAV